MMQTQTTQLQNELVIINDLFFIWHVHMNIQGPKQISFQDKGTPGEQIKFPQKGAKHSKT